MNVAFAPAHHLPEPGAVAAVEPPLDNALSATGGRGTPTGGITLQGDSVDISLEAVSLFEMDRDLTALFLLLMAGERDADEASEESGLSVAAILAFAERSDALAVGIASDNGITLGIAPGQADRVQSALDQGTVLFSLGQGA